MPPDNQRGRLPRSSKPGRPLMWKFPEAELGVQWGTGQDTDYDNYVVPSADRVRRRLAMPTVVRLVYDKTEYDDDPPVGFQYYLREYEENPDFDVEAAALSLGLIDPPYGAVITFLTQSEVYDIDVLSLVPWNGAGAPPNVRPYVSLSLPVEYDVTSGDLGIVEPPPPLTLSQVSYVEVYIFDTTNPSPGVLYYSGPSSGTDGDALIGTDVDGPPL